MYRYFLIFLSALFLLFSCDNKMETSRVVEASAFSMGSSNLENTTQNHFVLPEIPKKIVFAGETVSFQDLDIKERMDYEMVVNNFWHSSTIMIMKRANRWFPLMKKILKEENIPEDLIYVAIIESGLLNVVSPAGAKGFWQIMEGTGKEYGMVINEEIDERYDLEKSTRVACQYLKKAYLKFGTWSLAMAAYNRGMNGIERDIKEQKVNNYFDLSLNNETARYVFRAFALKLIFENPELYGFYLEKEDLYPPYATKEVVLDTTVTNIYDWAISQEVSIKILRKLNPWIIGKSLTLTEGKELVVKLPKDRKQLRLLGHDPLN